MFAALRYRRQPRSLSGERPDLPLEKSLPVTTDCRIPSDKPRNCCDSPHCTGYSFIGPSTGVKFDAADKLGETPEPGVPSQIVNGVISIRRERTDAVASAPAIPGGRKPPGTTD